MNLRCTHEKAEVANRPSAAHPDSPAQDDLWHAYDLAQRHYEVELQLFTNRMNLFLLVQSALITVVTGVTGTGKAAGVLGNRSAVASFGLVLAIAWLIASASSYVWIKTWRGHMLALTSSLKQYANFSSSPTHFRRHDRRETHRQSYGSQILWKQLESFTWYVRPTLIMCCLPIIFIGGWIYLGWFA